MATDTRPSTRILIIGKRGGILHWPEHLMNACHKMGLQSRFLALNHQNQADRLVKRLKGLVNKQWQEQHLANQLQNLLLSFKPDLLIFPDLIFIPETVKRVLRQTKSHYKSMYWIGDFFPNSIKQCNDFIDRFYFTDSYLLHQAQDLGLNRATYLPLAVDVSLFLPHAKPWQERSSALLFAGAYSDNRYQIIRNIKHPVQIYGKGWDKPMPAGHQVHPRNIPLSQVAQLYGSHRYVLNIINSNNIKHGLNMRCFEAISAGAILVTDRVKDFGRCFSGNDPVICYDNVEELNSLLDTIDNIGPAKDVKKDPAELMKYDYVNRVFTMVRDSHNIQ